MIVTKKCERFDLPVSHKPGELGIAVASEQLDAVGGHGVERGCRSDWALTWSSAGGRKGLFRVQTRARTVRSKVAPCTSATGSRLR